MAARDSSELLDLAPGDRAAEGGPATHRDQVVLSVRDLVVSYRTGAGQSLDAIRGVSFDLYGDTALALVGESGCGKTTLGLALLRLLPRLGQITAGSLVYHDKRGRDVDVLTLQRNDLRRWRWSEAAMVFQGAMNAFNPVLSIGNQMADTIRDHAENGKPSSREVTDLAGDALRSVRLEPRQVLNSYPHQLSGGMRQRALIAMSLLLDPRLLILDEPTTALDILTQRSIVDLLAELRAERGFAMIFISHDLSLAAELADRVVTMYAGRIIETGTARDIFYAPKHPYTSKLINAVPTVVGDLPELASIGGSPPSLADLPSGCSFRPRCDLAIDECAKIDPPLIELELRSRDLTHASACIRTDDVHHERKVIARA